MNVCVFLCLGFQTLYSLINGPRRDGNSRAGAENVHEEPATLHGTASEEELRKDGGWGACPKGTEARAVAPKWGQFKEPCD